MSKSTFNTPKVLLLFLAIFSGLFFGLVSLMFVQIVNTHYIYLLAPPAALLIALVFFYDRYAFFFLVILSRASLDAAFNAIKIGNFGLGAVLNALVILIALLTLLEKPVKLDINLSGIKKVWAVFLGLAFLSLSYTPSFVPSLKVFLIYVSYASMLALGLHLVKTSEDFGKWMKAIAFSSIIPGIYCIYSILFGGSGFKLYKFEGWRLQGPFPHANPFATYLVLMVSISFYLYKSKAEYISSGVRRLLPVYVLFLLGLLLMTKTRSAWIVTYLFFFLYAVFHERKFLIIVIATPFLALLIPEVQERIADLTTGNDFGSTGYERLNSFAWRLNIWQDSIAWMEKKHYLFGYGVSSFQQYSQKFAMANTFQNQEFDINAHNIYVQTFFELGIVGFLALVSLLFVVFKTLLSNCQRDKLLIFTTIAVFTQFFLQSFMDNLLDYLIVEWYMWFFIGISLAYIGRKKNFNSTTLSKSS